MLTLLLVPVLLGVSMIAQRPVSRMLKVRAPLWPLFPFAAPLSHRLAIRGAGVLFTFALVLLVNFLQARREQHLTARVDVAPGLSAAEGGVQTGDLITAIDGAPISDFADVRDHLIEGPMTKTLTVLRGDQSLQLEVTLKDGLLGVKASGEEHETPGTASLRTALSRSFITPYLLLRELLEDRQRFGGGADGVASSRAWAAGLTITLTISFWLMLVLELLALAVGALAPTPPRPN
jgi:membrane-associated protease RseP (regulator of RpoE activity)